MKLPSVMSHQFSRVPKATIPRSSFDRSAGLTTAFNGGYLVPIFLDEVLPGDTFRLNAQAFARLATPLHPIMDNLRMETFFFFVPNRLVWSNWQKFCGEQTNPGDSTDFTIPQLVSPASTGWPTNSVYDYYGLPVGVADLSVSALPLRGMNLIWNEWFRDQNLQNVVFTSLGDGPDSSTSYAVLSRGKRHDYFTSCLPWPQKGSSVTVPIGTEAKVLSAQEAAGGPGAMPGIWLRDDGGSSDVARMGVGADDVLTKQADQTANVQFATQAEADAAAGQTVGHPTGLFTDLANATAVTINELRQAFQIQKLLERDARGGTRYTEVVKAHFGVTSPDARLQRPEYLGGGSAPVTVSPVAQTSATDAAVSPQGNLAAIGTTSFGGHGFMKSFTEHGYIHGFVSVRADLRYQQGLDRMWSRLTRYEFYWPALSHIGEQAVLSKEIYCDGTSADDDVFGYQERYAEYRYKPSKVTGLMRSQVTAGFQSLDVWHLAQDFSTRPLLNENFIVDKPPIDRVIAVQTEPHFLFDMYGTLRTARPMPVYGVPGLIDHF